MHRLTASFIGLFCALALGAAHDVSAASTASKVTRAKTVPQPVAAPQTVCTITVNSADEKEVFRRYLPAPRYRFVELVEHNRSDWLNTACQAKVSCDVLIISGHFDGSSEFFSDDLERTEHLPVAELERVSCSNACPSLFSQLKEVYLFGCNTLNPQAQSAVMAEVVRSLVRGGQSTKDAERQLSHLATLHGASSRDRMRQIFEGVPVIYGFSSLAPLGPLAADSLNRHFQSVGASEVGRGRPSARLLSEFSRYGMSVAAGVNDRDPEAEGRRETCQFADDRLSDATKLDFIHQVLRSSMASASLYLDRIQAFAADLNAEDRKTPEVASVLNDIVQDTDARQRFLDFARGAEQLELRNRMINLARDLGWLSAEQRRQELGLLLAELQRRSALEGDDIDLACTLNAERDLNGFALPAAAGTDDLAHAAVRACLGVAEDRARTLAALVDSDDADVQLAQVFLRHRPITEADELRQLAAAIAAMPASPAQVRALDTLGRHYLSDRSILDELAGLYVKTPSAAVQAAIAGILIRADRRALAAPQLLDTLRRHRRTPPGAGGVDGMVDALIRRLQMLG